MQDIDPVTLGRLLQSVDTLNENMSRLTKKVEELETRLTFGKGIGVGLMMLSGGMGAGAVKIIEHQFFR